MILKHIDIVNFKNITEASLEFSPALNCFVGSNGMGKSNMLEAIHFLSMARATSSLSENALITHGADMLIVKGEYEMDSADSQSVACGITRGKGKTLKCNGKEYQRISEHIGRFPIVTISPADSKIVEGAAEERRRLLDMVISQARPDYLATLIRYNKALESRNAMLRSSMADNIILESVELSMAQSGQIIHDMRQEWVNDIAPDFQNYYSLITNAKEDARIIYKSSLNDADFMQLLNESRQKDLAIGYTTRGIHRDDIEMKLDGYDIRRLGSQGQSKSFTIALRLAIFEFIRKHRGITPLLLLDDIFDRLDAERVKNIMHIVSDKDSFNQIFITDTNRVHIDNIIRSLSAPHTLWNVENGQFSKI